MRRLIKRVLFGKRSHRKYQRTSKQPSWLSFELQNRINEVDRKLNNLMTHLKVQTLNNSNLVGDTKDAKKFNKQWD